MTHVKALVGCREVSFENKKSCVFCRYDTRKDRKFEKDAPVIGLVLQRSHLVTGDEGHYAGVVSEMEARGAKVVPVFAGG